MLRDLPVTVVIVGILHLSSALKLKVSNAPHQRHMCKKQTKRRSEAPVPAAVQLPLGCSHSSAFCLFFYWGLEFFVPYSIAAYWTTRTKVLAKPIYLLT